MVPRPRKTRHGTWQADLRKYGRGQPAFRTLGEAEDAIFEAEQQHRSRLFSPGQKASGISVADWLDAWVELRQSQDAVGKRRRARSTLANEQRWVEARIKPALGRLLLDDLTTDHINAWIDDMLEAGLKPATVGTYVRKLHASLEVAVEKRLIPTNPARHADKPSAGRTGVDVLMPDQVERIAAVIGGSYGALVYTLAYSGLRIGEACALRTEHLELSSGGGLLHVREKIVDLSGTLLRETHLKTAAGLRSVPIPEGLCRIIEQHLDSRPDGSGDTVFPTTTGAITRPNNWRNRRWYPATEKLGMGRMRVHVLRHTAISRWIAEGANELEVTRWAGHSSVKVTHDVYGHLFDPTNPEVMRKLDSLLTAGKDGPAVPADVIDMSGFRKRNA